MLSFTAPYKSRTNIFVQPTDLRTEAQRITEIKDREIFDYYWKDDSRIIYFKDIDGDENYHLFVVNVQTKETTDLTPFEGVDCEMLDLLDGVSEDEVLVIMNKENTEAFDVYRLNIKTSDLELIVKNPGNVINWATDHNGVVRVAFTKDGTNDSVYYRDTELSRKSSFLLSLPPTTRIFMHCLTGEGTKLH
jgi:protease II